MDNYRGRNTISVDEFDTIRYVRDIEYWRYEHITHKGYIAYDASCMDSVLVVV